MINQSIRRIPLAMALAVASLAVSLLASPATLAAADPAPVFNDGRLPGLGNFKRQGEATYRFIPSQGEYEVRRPGEPPSFLHVDYRPPKRRSSSSGPVAAPGPGVALPGSESATYCRTSGQRIVIVYTHRSSDGTPTPTSQIRSIVKRMNWKISDQSSLSSGGSRIVRMLTECSGGEIAVHNVTTANNSQPTVEAAVEKALGAPSGSSAVKYLAFDHSTNEEKPTVAGLSDHIDDLHKKRFDNSNANVTNAAVIYPVAWENHVTIHELFHALGATQGEEEDIGPAAPFSTEQSHCNDGIDILCLEDKSSNSSYSEKYCPEGSGYYDPVKVPIDCNKDTYFDALPTPETWLDEYWNLGYSANPFLVAPPKASTEDPSPVYARQAFLKAKISPEGTDTSYYFEYGLTKSYGSKIPLSSKSAGYEGTVTKSELITGLEPQTTYHYRVVATNELGTATGADKAFTTKPLPTVITEDATSVLGGKATLRGTINPNGIGGFAFYQFEYGTSTEYGSKTPPASIPGGSEGTEPRLVTQTISGLKSDTTYHFRLVAVPSDGPVYGSDKQFTPEWKPTASTESPSDLEAISATLNGKVNPKSFSTTYQFEYGTSEAYGSKVPASPKFAGSGTSDVKVSEPISGLKPGTTYHYRVVATNAEATTASKDETFTTPPIAVTGFSTKISPEAATLNASVNPVGLETSYQFEYGPTTEYGTKVPLSPKSIGSGTKPVAVSESLEGLKPASTYHFRVVATNAEGTFPGEDVEFSTWGAWSLQTTPNPKAQDNAHLAGVSCASSSACLAVGYDYYEGRGLAEFWNGKEWTLHKGSLDRRPTAVSCGSASACLAVGVKNGTSPLAEVWEGEGGSWWEGSELAPKTPEGGTSLTLEGVSCTAATTCTAVGSYLIGGKSLPLIERLSGFSWSIQTPATANQASLSDVSCASSSHCVSVGGQLEGATGTSLAERWDGTKWSTLSVPSPAGATGSELQEVSCSSTSACLALGTYTASGSEKPFAAAWNGSTWTLTSTGLKGAIPQNVSCKSATFCLAVGNEAGKTLVQAWDGKEWSTQTSPNPEGKTTAQLAGVSCASTTACTAVGSSGASGEYVTLGEGWNGTTWSLQTTPNPKAKDNAQFAAVSCATSSACLAVGYDYYEGRGVAEFWNGKEWTLHKGSLDRRPTAVSCGSASACLAVGVKNGTSPLAEVWEGEGGSWWEGSELAPKTPEGGWGLTLEGVSCTAATTCTAVGSYLIGGKSLPLIERLSGFSWSMQTPATANQASLNDVSCASSSHCVSVGGQLEGATGTSLAERWDGTKWSTLSVPSPAGATGSELQEVSCSSTSACLALGTYTASGSEKPFAAAWNGTAWTLTSTGLKGAIPQDVSCKSATFCLAVGNEAGKTLVQAWDGKEWSTQTSPNPEGKTTAQLAGVSCASTTACTAVGSSGASGEYVTLGERYE